jgi:hypothetical protein
MVLPRWFLGILALVALARPVVAADLVVVNSSGIDLAVGQAVDGSKALTLKEGERIVLIAPSGQIVRLHGPWDAPPLAGSATANPDVKVALKALLTQSLARTESVGVVRRTSGQVTPPEPWLLDVSRDGNRCLPENRPIMFWRPDGGAAHDALSISPRNGVWEVRIDWPQGADRLRLPPSLLPRKALFNHSTYVVGLSGRNAEITLISIPAAASNDAMRAAWMIEEGCDVQAQALLRDDLAAR